MTHWGRTIWKAGVAWKAGVVLFLGTAVGAMAVAQQSQGRAVRLSDVEGQVRIAQAGAANNSSPDNSGQPSPGQAVANTPLFEGSILQTGDDGRAELQFDDGSIARIPPDSVLTLFVLRPGQTEMTLNGGMGYFELKGAEKVDFNGIVASTSGSAVLRVKLDEAQGEVAVFDGAVHLDGPSGSSADLRGGESVKLGTGSYNVAESIEPDSWDAWNSDRDQALATAAGSSTPATQSFADGSNPAWGDLNETGNWYNVPGEGYVWSPYEASDASWDPYGNGYWNWSPGYGYIWASGESWGYMPYQCGLWNWYSGFGWGWAPGMGGCSPWWGLGGGGIWAINVGGRPVGWRPPTRPHGPGYPRPGGGGRVPASVIAVRRQGPPTDSVLPLRDRKTPVTIGSETVSPLRAVNSNRPVYNHQRAQSPMRFEGAPNNNAFGAQGASGNRQTYTPGAANQQRTAPSTHFNAGPSNMHTAPAPQHFSAPPAMPHFSAPAGGGGRR